MIKFPRRVFSFPLLHLIQVFSILLVILTIIHFFISTFDSSYRQHVANHINSRIADILEPIDIQTEYKKYIEELGLSSPGEFGVAVELPSNISDEVKKKVEEGYDRHGFNAFVSNMISVNRKLNDTRVDICKNRVYTDLPKVSIIIPVHNEEWTLLLRTVHALVHRAPDHLLEEIILVDDASDRGKLSLS